MSLQDVILGMNTKKTDHIMMNTIAKFNHKKAPFNIDPILQKAAKQARKEHRALQHTFEMMGWGALPDRLKIEIKDDVTAMVDELKGQYSTCDTHVLRRRNSIVYWVQCYQDRICSLQTAIDALKVKKLS